MRSFIVVFCLLIAASMWGAAAWIVYNGTAKDAHANAGWVLVIGSAVAVCLAIGAYESGES